MVPLGVLQKFVEN